MYKYQVMPNLSPEDYAELKADIASRGVQVAVEYDEDGNILDGHHRVQACKELGISDWPKVVRVGWTEEQKREHARKLNMARRQLTREQRQELIRMQLKDTPEKSDRQIAQSFGVSNKTVSVARQELENEGQLCKLHTSTGSDGKTYPRQIDRKPITLYNPDKLAIDSAKQVIEKAAPALMEAVATGKVPLMQAFSVAASTSREQQEEAVKRLNEGAPDLIDSVNQQKLEEYLHITSEQRQEMENRIKDHDQQVDREFKLSAQIDKMVIAVLSIPPDEVDTAAQYWLEHQPGGRDEIIDDLSRCIERLSMLKSAFYKTRTLKVVKR